MVSLSKGRRGPDVSRWQGFLIQQGLLNATTDGVFGDETAAATRAFQQQRGLAAHGSVGPSEPVLDGAEPGRSRAEQLSASVFHAATDDSGAQTEAATQVRGKDAAGIVLRLGAEPGFNLGVHDAKRVGIQVRILAQIDAAAGVEHQTVQAP